jgi:hypothetical protein
VQEYTHIAVSQREESELYDTPLRVFRNQKKKSNIWTEEEFSSIEKLEQLLEKKYSAEPLHLFPVKDLPGYVEGDVRAWHGNRVDEE